LIRQLDRVVLKDVIGPWLFGVGLFSALLMAATYLNRLAGFISQGVPGKTVLELVVLLMPAILSKTFGMSVLLATLLAFGRLSSDSEVVAMRAAGASVYRIMVPVALFSALVSLVTFIFSDTIVPAAADTAKQINAEVVKSLKLGQAMPIARTLVSDNKLRAFVNAKNVNPATQELQGVYMVVLDDKGALSMFVFADRADYTSDDNWKLSGHVKIVSSDFSSVINVPDKVWPTAVPQINQPFAMFTADRDDDFDIYPMAKLRQIILYHKQAKDVPIKDLNNFEYGYWNKIAVPMTAMMFGILGAVLGIRNHRTGTAVGFALAVAIIFGYVSLLNFMNVWAIGGIFPAWVACFTPLVIAGLASGVIMWRRNG